MQTRQVTQVKIFTLTMNPMYDRMEQSKHVAYCTDRDKLVAWYEEQKAPEIWVDVTDNYEGIEGNKKNWNKTFKKDSILEWCNPLDNLEELNSYRQGIHEFWVDQEIFEQGWENVYKVEEE